tara:strand:+ start:3038 stop:4003 length:966 start_codon:yes stop_codon:yes gene_type:complete
MKYLMENWRGYMQESKNAAIYGDLYLFEEDNISKISFYDAISVLSESDDDADRFLENWERSVEYMLENIKLNEQSSGSVLDDAVLKASTQAYMAIAKLKGKAVAPVINVMKKLKSFEQKNPKTAKALKFTLKGLAVAVATAGLSTALASGGGPEEIQAVADALASVAPDVADGVAQVAQADGTEYVEVAKQVVSNQEQALSQVSDALSQSGDPGLQQVGDAAENTERVFTSFRDMLEAEYQKGELESLFAWDDWPETTTPEQQQKAVDMGIISPEELARELGDTAQKDARGLELPVDSGKKYTNIMDMVKDLEAAKDAKKK